MSKVKKKTMENMIAEIKLGSMAIAVNFGVPVRSGDLKNSFKITNTGKQIEISTDIYYMPYTNEKWISPRWKGAINPNEKWFEESLEFMAQMIARHTGGKYVKTE